MIKENNKFLPTLVNRIKYTKKVKVADIKTYLVDEFKLSKELDTENKKLKKELKLAEKTKEKYNLLLITLDEYKTRLNSKDLEITDLEKEITKLEETNKLLTNEKNNLLLKTKNINLEINRIKKDGIKEFKKSITTDIKNTKGHLSKDIVLDIISNNFSRR